jgi:type I restriction enzyme, R subunit
VGYLPQALSIQVRLKDRVGFKPDLLGDQDLLPFFAEITAADFRGPVSAFKIPVPGGQGSWAENPALSHGAFGRASAKTRALIEENTTFMDLADSLPVFKINKDYVAKLEDLPSPADKAAALEAILTAELAEDDGGSFTYRQLGERLARLKAQKDAADKAAEKRLQELQAIADEKAEADEEPERLGLTQPGEYGLFTVLREYSASKDEPYLADCARRMVAHLRSNQLLSAGWSNSKGGRMRVEQSLLAESWNPSYKALGFDADDATPQFLAPAVEELVNSDGLG